MSSTVQSKARREYREFLQNYIFPLLGIPHNNNIENCSDDDQELFCDKKVFQDELEVESNGVKKRYIYFCNNKEVLLKTLYLKDFDNDNILLCINIIDMFFKVSNYSMNFPSSSYEHEYYSDIQKNANYKMAVQKGICNWIMNGNTDNLEKLFELLEKWTVQTYEGNKVTLGFIVNPNAVSKFDTKYGSWCDFLDNDLSALFTDCIHSVIELDRNCNFVRYLSISENNIVNQYPIEYSSAYRFSATLNKYVTGNSIGIFLLSNGDIVLSKNSMIKLVKRNLKWLNFSYEAFKNSFGDYLIKNQIDETLLQNVFASMLDVSFSHGGGIIAVINKLEPLLSKSKNEQPILNSSDYLLEKSNDEIECDLKSMSKQLGEQEIKKRLLKRNVLITLVDKKSFMELDRKLRCELVSLDGALILDKNGRVCACGAIIKNDSGSTGGARGAASKKLSRYGFAVKISTDGYIELYIDDKKVYSIK